MYNFSLHVTTSIYPVPSICSQDQISDWFASLAECLHWNVRKKQKHFDELSDLTRSSSDDTLDSLEQKAESLSEAASSSATEWLINIAAAASAAFFKSDFVQTGNLASATLARLSLANQSVSGSRFSHHTHNDFRIFFLLLSLLSKM